MHRLVSRYCTSFILSLVLFTAIVSGLSCAQADNVMGLVRQDLDFRALAQKRLVEQAQEVINTGPLGSLATTMETIERLRVVLRETSPSDARVPDKELWQRLTWLLGLEKGDKTQPEPPDALLQIVCFNRWLAGKEVGSRYAWQDPNTSVDGQQPVLLDEMGPVST